MWWGDWEMGDWVEKILSLVLKTRNSTIVKLSLSKPYEWRGDWETSRFVIEEYGLNYIEKSSE